MARHRLRFATLTALASLLLLPLPASAWNAAGHRLSALIAWQQLDETTRERISRVLALHPDHDRWIARAKGSAPEVAAFLEASTWPDLHAYWDDLAGPPWLRGRYLERAAETLIAAHTPPPPSGGVQRWIDESWQIARDAAYPPGDEAVPTLTADFHQNAQTIARQRVAEAGYRLATLLQSLFSRP